MPRQAAKPVILLAFRPIFEPSGQFTSYLLFGGVIFIWVRSYVCKIKSIDVLIATKFAEVPATSIHCPNHPFFDS